MIETTTLDYLQSNFNRLMGRVRESARKVNRNPSEINLVAVTKTVDIETIRQLIPMGITNFGENRIQELVKKATGLPPSIIWHMVGHLQTNKVKRGLPVFDYLHSLDSLHLMAVLEKEADRLNKQVKVFIQVNVSGEGTKSGVPPLELADFYRQVQPCRHLKILGLMTMAPLSDDPELSRPVFRKLRELLDELRNKLPDEERQQFKHLSMGMSQDFEVAIEEGATFIRIGMALFGKEN